MHRKKPFLSLGSMAEVGSSPGYSVFLDNYRIPQGSMLVPISCSDTVSVVPLRITKSFSPVGSSKGNVETNALEVVDDQSPGFYHCFFLMETLTRSW